MKTIEEILRQTINIVPFDKQVWDAQQCADYLGCSTAHFQNRITKIPTFPSGHTISEGEKPTLRWKAIDVFNWVNSRKLIK